MLLRPNTFEISLSSPCVGDLLDVYILTDGQKLPSAVGKQSSREENLKIAERSWIQFKM